MTKRFKTYQDFVTFVDSKESEYQQFTQSQKEAVWSQVPMHWVTHYLNTKKEA